jgi:hypothetical protein
MYSSESCRAQMQECKDLLSLAGSQAEATVLNLLIRNWRNIANQTDRYAELVRNKLSKE